MHKRILLLDDDPEFHDIFEDYLGLALPDNTFTFRAATTCEEAESILSGKTHTVVFVDYRLGAGTGIEFIRNCAVQGIDVPFVLLTGFESSNVDKEALAIGAFDFMPKDDLRVESLSRCVRFAAAAQESRNDLKVALRLAQDAAKARSEFLGNLSHEFRTPLNGVMGFATILKSMPDAAPEKIENYANMIHESGQRLLELFEGMLVVAEKESGTELNPSHFKLQDCIAELCERFETIAKARNIRFSLKQPHPPLIADTDPAVLALAIKPVIANAVKFTDPGGEVAVDVSIKDWLKIAVTDTGRGMDIETLQQACIPFFHHETYLSREYGGQGLGLAVAKTSIAALGGVLDIDSEPGHGTRVLVGLPLENVLAGSCTLPTMSETVESPNDGGFHSYKDASD
ncbi:MAG: hybrid sensor histidine kinase/response regulator [Rhodospirillales bacterium]|nr:hybrid sensor histidine kinase/response regulator [Rhodospirillales bacterium]